MAFPAQHGGHSAPQQTNAGHFAEGLEVANYQHGQYPEHYNPPPAPVGHMAEKPYDHPPPSAITGMSRSDRSEGKILGMKKGLFLTVLGIIILLLLGLIIGLGAGLGTKLSQSQSTR